MKARSEPALSLGSLDERELLELEGRYCSWGDTVHYAKQLNFFTEAKGSYLYDRKGTGYLDLQMWYSAANFGYRNERLNTAIKRQIDTLPAARLPVPARGARPAGGQARQADRAEPRGQGQDPLQRGRRLCGRGRDEIVRNHTGRNHSFAFMGGYHGRTLGATAITSSYRYREHYGHFSDRANFIPYPYCFRCHLDKKPETCGLACLRQFEKLFESEYYSVVNPKNNQSEYGAFFIEPVQATGGYIVPPLDVFQGAEEGARPLRHTARRRRDPDGLLPDRKVHGDRAFRRRSGRHRLRQGDDERVEPDIRDLGARGAHLAPGFPAGLDALDLLGQPARHRGRAGRHGIDRGRGFRGHRPAKGSLFPEKAGRAQARGTRASARSRDWAWRCGSRCAATTASRRTGS